jgi:hypothetical protein
LQAYVEAHRVNRLDHHKLGERAIVVDNVPRQLCNWPDQRGAIRGVGVRTIDPGRLTGIVTFDTGMNDLAQYSA